MSAANFLEAAIVLESRAGRCRDTSLTSLLERGASSTWSRSPLIKQAARRAWQTLRQRQPPSGPELRRLLRLRARRDLRKNPCCSRATISRLPTSKLLDALKLRDWVTSRGTFVGALSAPPRQLTRLEEARASTRCGLEPCHPSGRGLEVVAGAGHAAPWGRLGR